MSWAVVVVENLLIVVRETSALMAKGVLIQLCSALGNHQPNREFHCTEGGPAWDSFPVPGGVA